MIDETVLTQAAEAIRQADALLIGAGAGMGVDSGLPDFRGNEGFWNAYPPYKHLGLSFIDMANPNWFRNDPGLAWGFYGHRLHLYRSTAPHDGFAVLHDWMERIGDGFVFTSNVDGHFQRAGFDKMRVVECHGSLNHLQCSRGCRNRTWSAEETEVEVDPESFRATLPHPKCPDCGALARPNILMFSDWGWCPHRTSDQEARFQEWLETQSGRRVVVIECGAGGAVPTVRHTCEAIAARHKATLIRINPREPDGPVGTLSIAAGTVEAIGAIARQL